MPRMLSEQHKPRATSQHTDAPWALAPKALPTCTPTPRRALGLGPHGTADLHPHASSQQARPRRRPSAVSLHAGRRTFIPGASR